MKKIALTLLGLVCAFCCALGLAACENTGNTVAVESVTLNKTTLTLEIDETETLTATVSPDNATNKNVAWQSSAPDVASVDNAGKITAKAAGNAKITATADGKKAECDVTVNAAVTKMTEQEWKASFTAFVTAKNFYLTLSVADFTAGEVKMNGDTYYDKGGNLERILVKDGSKYYRYDKMSADADWTKAETTAAFYNEIVNVDAYNLVSGGSQAFGNAYELFDYSDGKYTAATVNVATGFTLKDIEVTIENGAIKKIVCTQVGIDETPDTLITIDGIGTTEITLPKIKEPTQWVKYRIPKGKNYAVVSGMEMTMSEAMANPEIEVLIASEFQGYPVKVIEKITFSYDSIITGVIIPDSVTSIESGAFSDCKNLTKLTLPDGVTDIGGSAFKGCTKLATIAIPDSVTSIGYCAFENTAWFDSQPDGTVYAGKVAYAYKGDKAQLQSVTIREGTKSISPMAFYECENLTQVIIPDSVTSIGNEAFRNCIRLDNVSLGNGVESIGNGAFSDCKFESVALPASLKSIAGYAFSGGILKTINFRGSEDQWNSVKKDANWNMTYGIYDEPQNLTINYNYAD